MKTVDFSAAAAKDVRAAIDQINRRYAQTARGLRTYDFLNKSHREMAHDHITSYEAFLSNILASLPRDMESGGRDLIEYTIETKRRETAELRKTIPTVAQLVRARAEDEYSRDTKSRS